MAYAFTATQRSSKVEYIEVSASEFQAVDETELLVMDESYIAAAEQFTGSYLQHALNEAVDARGTPLELTENKFHTLYDPLLPTVAFDATHALSGAELIGMSAARGTKKEVNVVFLNMATCGFTYSQQADGSVIGSAQRVHIIDGQGNVLSGEMPEAVRIDAIESVDIELLNALNTAGFSTLSNPENLKKYEDKHLLGEIGLNAAIQIPTRFSIDDVSIDNDVVIKPSNASQGRGIYFGSQHNRTVDDWQRYYTYLDQKNYAPVIEERVDCWPFFDPKTGEKLDWNVRAIISHGKVIDMYIRAGAEASAVNKSTGAKAIPMQDLSRYLGDDAPASANVIKGSLLAAAESLAESMDDFIIGADLTINSMGEVVTFEVNAGHVGGLQTMAGLEEGSKTKRLLAAKMMLDGIATRMPSIEPINGSQSPQKVPLSLNMKVDFLRQTNMMNIIGDAIDESTHADVEPYTRLHILLARLFQAHASMSDSETSDGIIEAMMTSPLEAAFYMPYIPALGSQALKDAVAELVVADPYSKEAKISKIYVAADDSDLSQLLEIARNDADKDILKHAGIAMRRIAKDAVSGLGLDTDRQKELIDVLRAHIAVMTLTQESELIYEINNIFIQTCKNVPEKYSHIVLSRTMLLMGEYDLAERHMGEIDTDDDAISDYHIDTLNFHQQLIVESEAGQNFIAHHFMGMGGAEVLQARKETHGVISEEAERVLALFNDFFDAEAPVAANMTADDIATTLSLLERGS